MKKYRTQPEWQKNDLFLVNVEVVNSGVPRADGALLFEALKRQNG